MSIYEHSNYKDYFNSWIETQPKKGFGELRRAALALNVSTTMMSQVFRGDKHLSLELANELCDYLNLSEDESEYFLLLVDYNRAGSHGLKKRLERQIRLRQEKARKVENRVKKDQELSAEAKSIYYSSWIYQAIKLLTDVKEYRDVVALAERLHLPRNQVQKALDFLLENRLVQKKEGMLQGTTIATHIGSSHLLVSKHHQNWRLQGFNKMIGADDSQLFYTAPCSLSQEDAEKVRQMILDLISQTRNVIGPSPSEKVHCLNIDWFEI